MNDDGRRTKMLNEKGQRELVYVVKIDGIIPIDGADRVEIAQVGGWRIMVKKEQKEYYKLIISDYAKEMSGYTHKDQTPYWT